MTTNLVTRNSKRPRKANNLLKLLFQGTDTNINNTGDEILHTINIAKDEMQDAQNFFDNVIEPELIDHAIYRMEAAKSRYAFLIKKAKDKGIYVDILKSSQL